MIIDIDRLKHDLKDYFGTALIYNQMAMIDLIKIDTVSDNEIINIAIKNGFNIHDYEITNTHKR